jgi:hypothetical protein
MRFDARNHANGLDKPGHDAFGDRPLVCHIAISRLSMPNAITAQYLAEKQKSGYTRRHEQTAPFAGQYREAAVPALLPPGQKARGKIFNRSFRITH